MQSLAIQATVVAPRDRSPCFNDWDMGQKMEKEEVTRTRRRLLCVISRRQIRISFSFFIKLSSNTELARLISTPTFQSIIQAILVSWYSTQLLRLLLNCYGGIPAEITNCTKAILALEN